MLGRTRTAVPVHLGRLRVVCQQLNDRHAHPSAGRDLEEVFGEKK